MPEFQVVSPHQPQGDQPAAIDKLVAGASEGKRFQTLLGATGTGKTFTMAHTIARLGRPALVISHNKTLAAQLYEEFKQLFPTMPSVISSPTTIITSPKPTYRSAISTSKKIPAATTTSIASASPPPATSSAAAMSFSSPR